MKVKLKSPNVSVELFFDRPKVLKAMDKKQRRVLVGTGAFYRTVVRRSMRSGGKKNINSKPGEPPRWHTKRLRNGIRFAYEPSNNAVVVGALPFRSRSGKPGARILELGGLTTVRDRKGRQRSIRIRPRPFIGKRSVNHPKGLAKLRELTRTVPLK